MKRYRSEERLGRSSAMDSQTVIDVQGGPKTAPFGGVLLQMISIVPEISPTNGL